MPVHQNTFGQGDDPVVGNASPLGGDPVRVYVPDDRHEERGGGVLAMPRRQHRVGVSGPGGDAEVRAKVRSHWKAAVDAASAMLQSAATDRGELFGVAVRLNRSLDQLWTLRKHRDPNWVSTLDLTQSALKQLAEDEIETATADQCRMIRDVVEQYLSPATKSPEDLVEATRRVASIGLSPFDGLAPLAEPESE